MAWDSAFRSALRSWKRMAGASGCIPASPAQRSSGSRCRSIDRGSADRGRSDDLSDRRSCVGSRRIGRDAQRVGIFGEGLRVGRRVSGGGRQARAGLHRRRREDARHRRHRAGAGTRATQHRDAGGTDLGSRRRADGGGCNQGGSAKTSSRSRSTTRSWLRRSIARWPAASNSRICRNRKARSTLDLPG